MTIGATPIQVSVPETMTDIGLAVLRKDMDTTEQAGQDMIKMMEQSVQPNLGQNIDLLV